MDRPVTRNIAFVVLRLILGITFIYHGWDKIFITGVDKMTGYFVTTNIPQTHLAVWVVALVELVGGALLILGLSTPTMTMVSITEMIGAWWSIHLDNGLFTRDNDAELVVSLIGGLVTILIFSAGRFSLGKQLIRWDLIKCSPLKS